MTIERNREIHGFTISCDYCSYTEDVEDLNFEETIEGMKDAKWKISRKKGEWDHECPSCSAGSIPKA